MSLASCMGGQVDGWMDGGKRNAYKSLLPDLKSGTVNICNQVVQIPERVGGFLKPKSHKKKIKTLANLLNKLAPIFCNVLIPLALLPLFRSPIAIHALSAH